MDKRRNSRLELGDLRPSSDIMLDENGATRPRVSRADLTLDTTTDRLSRPVSPISRETSPTPEHLRPAQSTRPHPSPIQTAVARAAAPAPAATPASTSTDASSDQSVGMAVSADADSEDSDGPSFNPNMSRFDRPDSSSSTYEPHSPYRSRISRISFSYPRRPGSAAGNASQPAHPYALYQQTMFEEPDEAEEPVTQTVPIGFPGRTVSFRRRTGPEGEELDVMGPDGHTEQLPPYSRYPEAGPLPQKPPHADSTPETPVSPISTQTPSPANSVPAPSPAPLPTAAAAIPPTVNAYAAPETPQPPPPSPPPSLTLPTPPVPPTTPQTPPQQQPQAETQAQDQPPPSTPPVPPAPPPPGEAADPRAITSSASSLSEEKARKKGWKNARRRRVICGFIPVWAVLLATFLSIFLAIIAGGVIGGLLSQQRDRKHRSPEVTVTSTAGMWDASPIPAPTGLPPLPSGRFFFPLGVADEQQRSCIEPSQDSPAWACNVPTNVLLIDFEHSGNYRTAKISAPLNPNEFGEDSIMYGTQPPKISPEQKMIWVTDVREAYRGPALHFQTVYDKVVVLDNDVFQTPVLKARRSLTDPSINRTELVRRHSSTAPMRHRLANEPGQEPWFCYWNSTYVEGFIYVQQPIIGAETQQFTAMRTFATDTTSASAAAMTSGTAATTPTTMTPSLTQLQARRALHRRDASASPMPTPAPTPAAQQGQGPPQQTSAPARFPFVIKVEERRLPNPLGQPYCQQMKVADDGHMVPNLDASGQPIIERIKEAAPSKSDPLVTGGVAPGGQGHQIRKGPAGGQEGHSDLFSVGHKDRRRRSAVPLEPYDESARGRRLGRRSNEPSNSCHCQWVSPQ